MASKIVAGGYKLFGPTYNSTKFVRFGHEGTVNSMHFVSPTLVPAKAEQIDIDRTDAEGNPIPTLAGKMAALDEEGYVILADSTHPAVGLIVDDIGDIANASNKVSYYFRGGEYYISVDRLGEDADKYTVGALLTVNENGELVTGGEEGKEVAVVTAPADVFTQGNMYANAGELANGGKFVGIQLRI